MLELIDLRVEYPLGNSSVVAVEGFSLEVKQGEFFTFLGPSGCGKTTTLRSVAGLEHPTGGSILIDGTPVFDAAKRIQVPTQRRDIAMVFQSYAIWPHMSVYQNVAFPLEAKGIRGAEARRRVETALRMVGLEEYIKRPATQLSGGQQQRVAFARAMVKEAKILLLDEPLSNLDAKLREQMRRELRQLQERIQTTAIYVTHDQEEALSLSDRIMVMNKGKVVELGTPTDLYLRPRSAFTARFIGQADLLPCQPVEATGAGAKVSTALGELIAGVHADLLPKATHLLLRPESIQFLGSGESAAHNVVEGTIRHVMFSGKTVEYEVEVASGQRFAVHAPPTQLRRVGEVVRLHLPPDNCVLLVEEEA